MQYFVVFVSLCLGGVLAATYSDSNLYIDSVLTRKLSNILSARGLNRAFLPNFQQSFPQKLSGTTVQVRADYNTGRLEGLQHVIRKRDCSAPFWNRGNATISCTLTFPKLEIGYNAKMGYGRVNISPVYANADVTGTEILVQVSTSTSRNFPELSYYHVRSIGHMQAEFINIGPMNSFQKTINQHFVKACSTNLGDLLNNQFRYALAGSVPQLTMPLPYM